MPDPLDMMSSVSLAFLMDCFAGPFLSLQIRLDLFVVAVQIFRLPIPHTVPCSRLSTDLLCCRPTTFTSLSL